LGVGGIISPQGGMGSRRIGFKPFFSKARLITCAFFWKAKRRPGENPAFGPLFG